MDGLILLYLRPWITPREGGEGWRGGGEYVARNIERYDTVQLNK